MSSTRISRRIKASRASVYRALLDPHALPKWKVPDGMTCYVHAFEGTAVDLSRNAVEVHQRAIEVVHRQPDGAWLLIVGNPNGRG